MLVLNVTLNDFQAYQTDNLHFMWTETTKEFILFKVFANFVVRTDVMKTTEEADSSFRLKNLFKHTAKFVLGFTIDGVSSTGPPSKLMVIGEKNEDELGEIDKPDSTTRPEEEEEEVTEDDSDPEKV